LVVSDLPTTPEGVTTEESDTRVIEQWSQIHLRIGIEAMTEIDERGEKMKHFTY
jgi:AMP nucleosidase